MNTAKLKCGECHLLYNPSSEVISDFDAGKTDNLVVLVNLENDLYLINTLKVLCKKRFELSIKNKRITKIENKRTSSFRVVVIFASRVRRSQCSCCWTTAIILAASTCGSRISCVYRKIYYESAHVSSCFAT